MTRGSVVTCCVGPMERLPPPVPPRPSKTVVAKALAKTRRAPPPPVPTNVEPLIITPLRSAPQPPNRHLILDTASLQSISPTISFTESSTASSICSSSGSEHDSPPEPSPPEPSPPLGRISHWVELQEGQPVHLSRCEISVGELPATTVIPVSLVHSDLLMAATSSSTLQSGLPPLPKSLSGALDTGSLGALQAEMTRQKQQKRPIPPPRHPPPHPPRHPPHRRPAPPVPPHSGLPTGLQQHNGTTPPTPNARLIPPARPPPPVSTLDTQLAVLRQEMVGLRQLDLSLLSQLWSLNESIQEFRVMLQEQEDAALSPPSADEADEMFRTAPSAGIRFPGGPIASLSAVPEQYILSSSSSQSSVEFGNV